MKKEVITAVAIGTVIGLLLTGGFFLYRATLMSQPTELYNPLIEDYPQQNGIRIKFSDGMAHQISLTSPVDQEITSTPQIKVSGQTSPESTVTILAENLEKVTLADNQGYFESSVNLISGENELSIIAFSPSGSIAQKKITVVVSSYEY